jgi:hypothetical protein
MPLLHCQHCHHEWEGRRESVCDWCGSSSFVLSETTPFESAILDICRHVLEQPRREP